jgi:hypothetical protein
MSATVFDNYIRTGNIGTDLIVNMTEVINNQEQARDLDNPPITSSTIELRKPRGTIISLSSSIVNAPGTDGKIHHTDGVGIFDKRGRWQIRGVLNYAGGGIFKGSWTGFTVGE